MIPVTRYARSGEDHVAYQTFGRGPLDILFLEGWRTNVEIMWEDPGLARFFERLGGFSRVIYLDKRGSGLSDPVSLSSLPTLEEWMNELHVVTAAVGCAKAAVIGDTEGGPLALLYAATYPERTAALVLVNTFARLTRDSDYPWGMPREILPRHLERFEREWGTGAALETVAPSLARDARFRQWYARYERHSLAPRSARATYAPMFDLDLRPVLPSIRVPTLVLHRAGNRYIRAGHGRYLADRIPGARYVELPGEDYLFHTGDANSLLDEIQQFLTGSRPSVETDRVLATVLFTDIVGSTEEAARLGDRNWSDLLDRHHGVVRKELGRFRGREVDTAGDGFFATFDGPGRAIRCAQSVVEAIRPLGIEIRAGVHTGEIELAGDKVSGIAVHIGARIAGLAEAGEVLVSSTVKDLVAGSDIRFTDRGGRVLKGVPGEWHLFSAE